MQIDILIVEDDINLRDALADTLEFAGYSVALAEHGQAAIARINEQSFRLIISDVQMQPMDGMELLSSIRQQQNLPVVMMTAYGSIEKAVDAMRLGAADYLVKPFEADDLLEVVKRQLPEKGKSKPVTDDLVAHEDNMCALKTLAAKVAESDATVLLCGESGVGKEVFARYIHNQSHRSSGPFIAINCAAIPENMLESVLFGYEKGSFTGAYQAHSGKFEQAQNGTLLLDEISEMDAALQAKLLRVLQEKEVERLGGRKTIALNVRVLATTNRILREEVAAGRFREDLFYRLSVFPIQIPALRDRVADIVPIACQILEKYKVNPGIELVLTPEAQQKLVSYAWPGNVRELDNVLQRAMILKSANVITAENIHFENADMLQSHKPAASQLDDQASVLVSDLKDREQQLILDALRVGKGSRKDAAERLGISPRTLRYKLARMRDAGIAV